MERKTVLEAAQAARERIPRWDDVDADALLNELTGSGPLPITPLDVSMALHAAFMKLEYDSPETTEEGEPPEEEDEEPPPPVVVPETRHSDALYDILRKLCDPKAESNQSGPSLPRLLATLYILKSGWGEQALRYAIKCAQLETPAGGTAAATGADPADGGVSEAVLWTALLWSTSAATSGAGNNQLQAQPLTPALRTHLRKAWRTCEKLAPPPPPEAADEEEAEGEQEQEKGDADEESEESESTEGAKGSTLTKTQTLQGDPGQPEQPAERAVAAAAPAGPPPPRVSVDEFVGKLQEDPVLAHAWTRDVPLPVPA